VPDLKPTVLRRVGVVGGGQLAHMMGEAASALDLDLTVLATSPSDSATTTSDHVLFGAATDVDALHRLAEVVDVITFDHELVDLDGLEALEASGVILRPSPRSLRYSVDKAYQRRAFSEHGLPVPRFLVVESADDARLAPFLDTLAAPPVVKSSRGGYDGRGVVVATSRDEALSAIQEMASHGEVVVEEQMALRSEVAQLVARATDGTLVFYPVVTTVQRGGMCAEVRFPSELDEQTLARAQQLSNEIADLVQGIGIMAVEYFVTDKGLFINEIALRPHNSGHWTIEGASTSQFAQHLRAVSGVPLGDIDVLAPYAVMVNVVGADRPGSLEAAQSVGDAFVHDYGKSWRPGRKLGHVTALGDEPTSPRVRAWDSARAYGTVTQEA
jgi:5-(carboxyamino)imidazole ribonucleotide synthase